MEPPQGAPPDLRSLLAALWRRKWLFLAILVSIPAATYAISKLVPQTYEASAVIQIQASDVNLATLTGTSTSQPGTESFLLETPEVREEAGKELGQNRPLAESVETQPLTTEAGAATDLYLLTAQARSANRAAAVANAYARAIDIVRTGETVRGLRRAIADLETQAQEADDPVTEAELARQLQVLRGAQSSTEEGTETLTAATPPSTPISPRPLRNTALAALFALLVALGAVALRERLDQRLREPTELEPLLGVPLLSVVPRAAFPGAEPAPGPVREAFRTVAASLLYFNIEQPVETVVVASPTKGDGKTTVATHLAAALANDGQKVVLVDADLRYPQIALRLGIEPGVGLPDVITRQAELEDALVEVDVGGAQIEVLAGGDPPPNPARLLGSERMDSLLEELSKRADVVIVDTPPILNVSDAVPLLGWVSGSVLVAKVDSTSRDALMRTRQVVEKAQGTILGAVATGARGVGLYGYGVGYYGYGGERVELPGPGGNGARPERMRGPGDEGLPAVLPRAGTPRAAAGENVERRRRWRRGRVRGD